MDGAADATMESELNGYGDTLHFILQFLHTEGFATTEEVLMQEIEKKLPAVIEQTIQKHGGAQLLEEEVQGGASQVTEACDNPAEFLKQAMLETEDTRRSKSADILAAKPRGGRVGASHIPAAAGVSTSAIGAPVDSSDPGSGPASPYSDRSRKSGGGPRSARCSFGIPALVLGGGNPEVDEYTDDEDIGYHRIQIDNQSDFLAMEIAREDADTEASYSTDSGSESGSSGASDAGDQSEHSDALHVQGRAAPTWDDSGLGLDSPKSETCDPSSRHSSAFSGVVSPAERTLAELNPELQIEIQRAREQLSMSPPLPPADAEVEVGWDLEIAAKPGSPSALSGSATTTGRVLGEDPAGDDAAGSLSASSDIDLMPPSPDEFSLPQPDTVHFSPEPAGDGLTFSPSPSAPLGGPLPVTSEDQRGSGMESKPSGSLSLAADNGNGAVEDGPEFQSPSQSVLPGSMLGSGGPDFAFPVTPNADDPSVTVFNTWNTIRSRSQSNASEFSGLVSPLENVSPQNMSPARDNSSEGAKDEKARKDGVKGARTASSSQDGAMPKVTSKLGAPDRATDVLEPPVASRFADMSASEQSRWQSEPEAAQQVLEVLEALEHAQSSGQDPEHRFGSYGNSYTRDSKGGGSPASSHEALPHSESQQEAIDLWQEEPADGSETAGSSGSESLDFDPALVPSGGELEGLRAEEHQSSRAASRPSSASQDRSTAEDVAEAKHEDEDQVAVLQYDEDAVSKMYDIFDLKIIHPRRRTGFEETKDFPIRLNDCIAGRYQILDYLGSAAFSRAVQALDLKTGMLVCLKIIKNNKDYFDQSLDEIKLLKSVNAEDPDDEAGILRLYDYFYYKEHLFIVCELLRANLYEFQKYNRESGDEPYFTLPRVQTIARQVLHSLKFLHGLGMIHSDLKPENVLIKSYSRCEVKVIDLGSSCYTSDHLSSYVQSRSYRAPEVILGLPYDQRVDVWSLGCILAELSSGYVLFQNDSLASLLARLVGILGPIPKHMLRTGRYAHRFFTKSGHPYERSSATGQYQILQPKVTSLAARVPASDKGFAEFLRYLLSVDPHQRPSAEEALQHPWLKHEYPQP